MHEIVIGYKDGVYTPLSFDGFGIGTTVHAVIDKPYESDYVLLKDLISSITGKPTPKMGGSAIYKILESWYNVKVFIKCNKNDAQDQLFTHHIAGIIEE